MGVITAAAIVGHYAFSLCFLMCSVYRHSVCDTKTLFKFYKINYPKKDEGAAAVDQTGMNWS